ncbi:MAG: hypothetical protein EXS31_10570 [Pedosphaera sp.]|nr:hypothetical protein [Pedosphaera sp.]
MKPNSPELRSPSWRMLHRGEAVLPWLIYPVTLTLCLWLHTFLRATEVPTLVAAYAGLVLGAGVITLFEWLMPERHEWSADQSSVLNDLAFMVVVQMALPPLLSLFASLSILHWLEGMSWTASHLWAHGWPVWAQVALMILVADFLRYWLHVACHRFPFLWRLHSVHHSPKKLYWLNVGRFHPLERALQFLFDALPFMFLGVGEEVLVLFFVFHSVNGFFQHCNVRLRFGWLNYVISSAELHRWHHSKVIDESNANYGNHIILWDLLFGTWFLPKDRQVGELGLRNPEYPLDFSSQIKTPFVGGIDHVQLPLGTWRDLLLNAGLSLQMVWIGWRSYLPIKRAAARPAEMQKRVLDQIIADHCGTEFAKDHGLVQGMSLEAFRAAVGLNDYEQLRPYIERQDRTGEPCLNRSRPVMFSVTSGTSATPKYLPVLAATLAALSKTQRLVSWLQYHQCRDGYRGKILGIVSPAVEGHLESGTPFGSASGFLYRSMPRLAQAKYVLPPEVFEIADYLTKYYAILRLALPHRDITLMGSANPSTFLRLLDLLRSHREALLEDLEKGTFHFLDAVPDQVRQSLLRRCRPEPKRAMELRVLLSDGAEPNLASLWPYVRLVTTWTGGSCGIALESLRSKLPANARIMDLGYLASELRVTVTIDAASGAGLPTFWENFFEFVATEEWERGEARFLTLDQLEKGRTYYIFVTTPAGLFRYPMHDIVQVRGRFRKTPTLRFLQKGIGCTNITGEKLYESQVLTALAALERLHGFRSRFFQLLADEDAACYTLYLELDGPSTLAAGELAMALDQELGGLNVEYRSKRESGRLRDTRAVLLRSGTYDAYKQHCLANGRREAQFKTVAVQYRRAFEFDLDPHAWEPGTVHS